MDPQKPNVPPQAPPESKGMSRGCLIGLIALGIVIVLIILAGITCYVYKDEIGKSAAVYLLNDVKSEVAINPPPGIDTTRFNRVVDGFMYELQQDTAALESLAPFFQQIQSVPEDEKIDSAEVILMIEAMVDFYPQLDTLAATESAETMDTTMTGDSL